jgi:hypothetical protein
VLLKHGAVKTLVVEEVWGLLAGPSRLWCGVHVLVGGFLRMYITRQVWLARGCASGLGRRLVGQSAEEVCDLGQLLLLLLLCGEHRAGQGCRGRIGDCLDLLGGEVLLV